MKYASPILICSYQLLRFSIIGIILLGFSGSTWATPFGELNRLKAATADSLYQADDIANPDSVGVVASALIMPRLDMLPTQRLSDVMVLFPGVMRDHREGLILSGVGINRFDLFMDDQRIPYTSWGLRSHNLDLIPLDLISTAYLQTAGKASSHSVPKGGRIQLMTANHDLSNSTKTFQGIAGGSGNSHYFNQSGALPRFTLRYSDRLRDDFTLSLVLHHSGRAIGSDEMRTRYDSFDFGSGNVEVLRSITPGLVQTRTTSTGATLRLNYQPNSNSIYSFRAFVLDNSIERTLHSMTLDTMGDWLNPDSTGRQGLRGTFMYDSDIQRSNVLTQMYLVEANHQLGGLLLNHSLSLAEVGMDTDEYRFNFSRTGINYKTSFDNRTRPAMEFRNIPLLIDGTIDPIQLRYNNADNISNEQQNRILSAKTNASYHIGDLHLSVGAVAEASATDASYSNAHKRLLGLVNLFRFHLVPNGSYTILDEYYLPWRIDTDRAWDFKQGITPSTVVDEHDLRRNSDILNFKVTEQTYSGYFIAAYNLDNLHLSAGVRTEVYNSDRTGRQSFFNQNNRFVEQRDTTVNLSDVYYLPSFQTRYSVTDWMSFRASFSRSLHRPDYMISVPFRLINASNNQIFAGKGDISPLLSNNINVGTGFSWYSGNADLAFYYRDITEGFVSLKQSKIESGLYQGWSIIEYGNNANRGNTTGITFSARQRLSVINAALSGLELFGSYTGGRSVLKDGSAETTQLSYSPQYAYSLGLQYDFWRFSGIVYYHKTAESQVQELTRPDRALRTLTQISRVEDRYSDGFEMLAATVRFRISPNFTFWADSSNLIIRDYLIYDVDRSLYPTNITRNRGLSMMIGLRYEI